MLANSQSCSAESHSEKLCRWPSGQGRDGLPAHSRQPELHRKVFEREPEDRQDEMRVRPLRARLAQRK